MPQLSQYSWDLPTAEVLPQVNTGWTPKYDYGILSDRQLNESVSPNDGTWVAAPTTSHISRFKFVDARQNSLVRRFGRVIGEGAVFGSGSNPFARGASVLSVIFKGKDGTGEVAEYEYYFNSHETGVSIYDQMVAAIHPYGGVLYPRVILGGVPYQRRSSVK